MSPVNTDKQMFLDMQEHPESYSDEQLETMMTELDREPDVEAAWEKLERKEKPTPNLGLFHRIAAIFLLAAFLGGHQGGAGGRVFHFLLQRSPRQHPPHRGSSLQL